MQSCDLQNWREALAAVLTYARPDEFAALCGKDSLQTRCHLFCLTAELHFAIVVFFPVNYCKALLGSLLDDIVLWSCCRGEEPWRCCVPTAFSFWAQRDLCEQQVLFPIAVCLIPLCLSDAIQCIYGVVETCFKTHQPRAVSQLCSQFFGQLHT